jgi:hypothetical protein
MVYQTQEKFSKIIPSHFVYSLRLLSILARQKSTEHMRKICLMIYQNQEKFQTIIPSRLKHVERLFSIIALPKSLENVRKISLMTYQTQEKFQKIISSPFEASSETTLDYWSPEINRKRAGDMSDDI